MSKSNEQRFIKMILCVGIFAMALWLFGVTHAAGPFMVSDPQIGVTSYAVTMNGSTEEIIAQDLGDNTTRLHYDLEGTENGSYDCSVTAKNVWGASEPTPFSFSKTLPESPSVLDISAQ